MTIPLFPRVNLALMSGVVSGQPHGVIHAGRRALAVTLITDDPTGGPSHPTALIITGPLVEQLFEALSDGTPMLCEGAIAGASHQDTTTAVTLRVTRAQCGALGGLIVEFNALASKASASKASSSNASTSKGALAEAPRALSVPPSRFEPETSIPTEPTSDEEALPIRRGSPRGRRGGRRHRGKYRTADLHTAPAESAETQGEPKPLGMRASEESESPRQRRPTFRRDRVTETPLRGAAKSTAQPASQITTEQKTGAQPQTPPAPPPALPAPFGIAETEERFDPFFHNRK